jgi:hypothetical protein
VAVSGAVELPIDELAYRSAPEIAEVAEAAAVFAGGSEFGL